MSYAIRNTIILGILLVTILAVGAYQVFYKMSAENNKQLESLQQSRLTLKQLQNKNLMYDEIEMELASVETAWVDLPRQIARNENSTSAYAYFNDIASVGKRGFDYNFARTVSSEKDQLIENSYTLAGETSFQALYDFITNLERNAMMYNIDELNVMPGNNKENKHWINYLMVVKGYAYPQEDLLAQNRHKLTANITRKYNPFSPLIKNSVPENENNLLDVRLAELIGLTGTTAYLRDNKNKIWKLNLNDKVYLGKLTLLSAENNLVEFSINVGGIFEKISKKVNLGSTEKLEQE